MKDILGQSDLRKEGRRLDILEAVAHAFRENDPSVRVRKFLEARADLSESGRIFVIGFGKAARAMYRGAKEVLGDRIFYGGIILPDDDLDEKDGTEVFPGTHPLLSEKSINSTIALLSKVKNLRDNDVVVVLISGGGSSLFEMLEEGVTLEDYIRITKCMMNHGADIQELNAVRFLLSRVKGGGLRELLCPARIIGLIISDVPGDDVRFIASGPLADPPDQDFIYKTLRKFGKTCGIHTEAIHKKYSGKCKAENHILLRNEDFVNSISDYLRGRGNRVLNLGSGVNGRVTVVSRLIYSISKTYFSLIKGPFFIVGGGETSVNVRGDGIGGRNLEMCLRFILNSGNKDVFVFSSIGTDGIDGPSNAMGGMVDQSTSVILSRKRIREYLRRSESLAPLMETKDVIISGRTGNNVSDIFIGYIERIY